MKPLNKYLVNKHIKTSSTTIGTVRDINNVTCVCLGNFNEGEVWLSMPNIKSGEFNNKIGPRVKCVRPVLSNKTGRNAVLSDLEHHTGFNVPNTNDDFIQALIHDKKLADTYWNAVRKWVLNGSSENEWKQNNRKNDKDLLNMFFDEPYFFLEDTDNNRDMMLLFRYDSSNEAQCLNLYAYNGCIVVGYCVI